MSSLLPTPDSIRLAWCAMVLERQLVLEQTGVYIVTGGPDDGKVLLPPRGPHGMVGGEGAVQVDHGQGQFTSGIAVGGASLGARLKGQ